MMGLLIAALGVLFMLGSKLPFLGRLPGDFVVGSGNVKVFFPLATSILLSLLLTFILNLVFSRR